MKSVLHNVLFKQRIMVKVSISQKNDVDSWGECIGGETEKNADEFAK